jgi:hypothetical protein
MISSSGRFIVRVGLVWLAAAGLFASGLGCGGGGTSPVVLDAGRSDGSNKLDGSTAVDAGADTGVSTTPISYTFDTDTQGFGFDRFQDPTPGAVRNLASFSPPPPPAGGADGGVTADDAGAVVDAGTASDASVVVADAGGGGGAMPTLDFDGTDGNPAPGSLKVTVPYTDFNQVVDVGLRFDPSMQQNWTGKIVHVKVRLTSGTFGGGAVLYALTTDPSTPNYIYTPSGWTLLLSNQWHDIALDLRHVPSANQVIGFGVQFGTGGPAAAGVTFTPTTPVFNVDTFSDK